VRTRLALLSLPGAVLFAWPFLGLGPPPAVPALAVTVGAAGALLLMELGARQLDNRRLALLAALAALDSAVRLAFITGIAGFNPVFFLILCAGFAFGPSFGFLVGAFSLLTSALVGGGMGPWVPFQVFAAGWVGAAAGLCGPGRPLPTRWDVARLAAVGFVTGFAFGALMDVPGWAAGFQGSPELGWRPGMPPLTALAHFGRYYLATSLAYDSFRAVGSALMVVALGRPVLAALNRLRARFTFEVVAA